MSINPLECKGNYSATLNKLVHWLLIGRLLHRYSEEETGEGRIPPRPLLAVPNVLLLYNGPLLYGFNVPIKGLRRVCRQLWQVRSV